MTKFVIYKRKLNKLIKKYNNDYFIWECKLKYGDNITNLLLEFVEDLKGLNKIKPNIPYSHPFFLNKGKTIEFGKIKNEGDKYKKGDKKEYFIQHIISGGIGENAGIFELYEIEGYSKNDCIKKFMEEHPDLKIDNIEQIYPLKTYTC